MPTPVSLPSWYVPEDQTPSAAKPRNDYTTDDVASANDYTVDDVAEQSYPDWYTPENDYTVDDVAGEGEKEPPAKASTAGYIATHALGGALEGAKQLGTAANLEMGYLPDAAETAALPPGQDRANRTVYGTANVPAPNVAARYAGDLASSI